MTNSEKKWTILAAVFTVLSFIVGAIALLPLTKSKSLTYEIRSETSFTQISDFGQLDIGLNGHKLTSPKLTVIRVSNTGNVPITAPDFDGPLRVVFSDGMLIEGIKIAETTPTGIPVQVNKENSEARVAPLLLNPGDTFDLSILTSNNRQGPPEFTKLFSELSSPPKVIARISDLSEIVSKSPQLKASNPQHPYLLAFLVLVIYGCSAVFLGSTIRKNNISTRQLMPEALVLFLANLGVIYSIGSLKLELSTTGRFALIFTSVTAGVLVAYRARAIGRTTAPALGNSESGSNSPATSPSQ